MDDLVVRIVEGEKMAWRDPIVDGIITTRIRKNGLEAPLGIVVKNRKIESGEIHRTTTMDGNEFVINLGHLLLNLETFIWLARPSPRNPMWWQFAFLNLVSTGLQEAKKANSNMSKEIDMVSKQANLSAQIATEHLAAKRWWEDFGLCYIEGSKIEDFTYANRIKKLQEEFNSDKYGTVKLRTMKPMGKGLRLLRAERNTMRSNEITRSAS